MQRGQGMWKGWRGIRTSAVEEAAALHADTDVPTRAGTPLARLSRPSRSRPVVVRIATIVLALGALLGGVLGTVATSQAAVTLPALAGHWPMLEGSGTSTADTSGNGNLAYLGTGASWSTGPGGAPAIALNGTSAGIVPVFKPVVNTSQSFTVSAWVKFNNNVGNQTFVSIDGTNLSGFFLQINGNPGKFDFVRWSSDSIYSSGAYAASGVTATAGTWYHVVGVDNTSTNQLAIYVNGTEDGTIPYSGNWQATGTTLIGRGLFNGNPTDFVNGSVSDVQFYQSALTTAQVDALNGTPYSVSTATAGAGSGTATLTDSDSVAACTSLTKCLVYNGDTLTFNESAGSGSRFTNWSGGSCPTSGSTCSFSPTKTEADTANFAKTVTISTATAGGGTGSATITDSDSLAGCTNAATCVADVGDSVTITATNGSNSRFSGWTTGSCAGKGNPCTFTVGSSGETDTASFAQTVTLSTATAGAGSGTATLTDASAGCTNVTTCLADVKDSVTITATAASGSRFTGWSGGTCSGSTSPCTFAAGSSGETDTANFAKTATIGTATAGSGSGTVTITDSDSLAGCTNVTTCAADVGDSVTITATAASGSRFTGWSGGTCSGSTSPCTFSAGSSGETDTANFAKTATINTSTAGSGTVTITDSNTLAGCTNATSCVADVGDTVTITATNGSSSRFTAWTTGSCAGKANPCSFTVGSSSETDTASFVTTLSVSTSTSGAGTGTVTLSDASAGCTSVTTCIVDAGDSVTITAAAGSSSRFTGFTSGSCNGKANPCTFTAGSSGETDTANFAQTITIGASTSGSGTATITDSDSLAGCTNTTSCVADVGDTLTFTETASSGNRFTGWSGGTCPTSGSTCSFPAAKAETDTANFAQTVTITAATTGSGTGTATITDIDPLAGCTNAATCVADVGDAITIATSATGANRLASWSGGTCSGSVTTCTFAAAKTETDTANFAKTVTITAAASSAHGSAMITDTDAAANCNGVAVCVADVGDTISIAAGALSGFELSGWSGGSCKSAINPCTFSASAPETDTAAFAATPTATVSAVAGPGLDGTLALSDPGDKAVDCANSTTCVVPVGDSVTLTAIPSAGYAVATWSVGSCSGTTCVLNAVTTNTTVDVQFALATTGDASQAVFVSPSGNDANPGTESSPVLTPQRGIQLIESSGGGKNQLRLAQGSYSGGLSLTAADDGISIYGDFDPTTWAATSNPATPTTISGAPQAVLADHATSILIQQVELVGTANPTVTTSVYGIRAIGGSSLTLSDVSVHAANALPGAPGANGLKGTAGGAGGPGGAGQTAAQVVAACLASGGSSCTAADGQGGAPGLGVNGNDNFLSRTTTYLQNELLEARSHTLPQPAAGPSAGDGGFGGWGSSASPSALQGCIKSACGPEQISAKTNKPELTALWFGSIGSNSLGVTPVADGAGSGANGYSNAAGDAYAGKDGFAASAGQAGSEGTNGSNPASQSDAWTPGNGAQRHRREPRRWRWRRWRRWRWRRQHRVVRLLGRLRIRQWRWWWRRRRRRRHRRLRRTGWRRLVRHLHERLLERHCHQRQQRCGR